MELKKKLSLSPSLNHQITHQIGLIEKFQGKWEFLKLEKKTFLNELRHIATIQSIGSSTRIEGSQLNDTEIEVLIQNLEINQLETRDEQEAIGYWETLELLHEHFAEIELSERYIFQLHALLLKYSPKDSHQRGEYKNLSNKVVAKYPDGTQKTIFTTTAPHMVSKEMEELLLWTNEELENSNINPLIVIGTFVYEFLSIHPFHDGNGRLSRLLTTLLLIRHKYYFVQFVSFEHIIEKRKKDYYKALMDCQKLRNTSQENIGLWLSFFLDCIIQLSKQLDQKLTKFSHNKTYLTERQRSILDLILKKEQMKISDISKTISYVSLATLKNDLKHLTHNGILKRNGQGRATTYSLAENE